MSIKILHSADLHFDEDPQCYNSFNQIIDYVAFNDVDLCVISGDVFDRPVVLEEAPYSPVNPTLDSFIRLANICSVYIVEGNPPHDKFGSLEVLNKLKTKYPIKVVSHCDDTFTIFTKPNSFTNYDIFETYQVDVSLKTILSRHKEQDSLIIFGLPWPIKPRFLSGKEMQKSLREVNELYKQRLEDWIAKRKKLFKSLGNRYGFLFAAHLQLNGSIASTGQELTSTYHLPSMYHNIAHYGALGHIHLAQHDKELYYSGSIRNKNWGELEKKQFNIIEYSMSDHTVKTKVYFETLNTPLMAKIVINGEEELKDINRIINSKLKIKAHYKVWISIRGIKNKDSVDKDKITRILEKLNSELTKIDVTEVIITSQRDRIINETKQTLKDKYIDWCSINDLSYTKFQLKKLEEAELLN